MKSQRSKKEEEARKEPKPGRNRKQRGSKYIFYTSLDRNPAENTKNL